ncbi:TIGR02594 family protein [Sinorhizobium meliloti]|nr:TIGR02594 family protein [Sinorhizobium meliloti]MDX0350173.1 TIGR02594 family protein [Sinorhizobium meliloti]
MATDLERLVVQLSADIKGYEREMARARGVANREFNAIERRAQTMNRRLDSIGKGFGRGMIAPLAGVAGALTVAEVIKYADAWKRAGNQLKVSGIPAAQLAGTLDRLYDIAQGAGADLGSTVTLFARLSQSAKDLGADQEQLFQFTKGVGDALKVAGTDAQSASGALLQLSQALGGAVVRAEEFNSINEGARPILQAVANGMKEAGGSVSRLREMVLDGTVTSRAFFEAFLQGSRGLAQQAEAASTTFGQAFQKIENAFTKYIGQTDEGLGASQRLIKGLEALADNFDATADTAIAFASILAAGLLGRAITGMIGSLVAGGAALINFTNNLRKAQATARAGIFLGGVGGAAGPLGAAIGVAAGAALYFATSADKAEENSEKLAEEMRQLGLISDKAAGGVDKVAASVDKLTEGGRALKLREIARNMDFLRGGGGAFSDLLTGSGDLKQLGDITQRAQVALKGVVGMLTYSDTDRGVLATVIRLSDQLSKGETKAEDVMAALEEMRKIPVHEEVDNLITSLARVAEQIAGNIKLQEQYNRTAGAATVAPDPRAAGFAMQAERERTARELAQRTKESQRAPSERELDAAIDRRAKEIMEKFGDRITDEAARVQARQEIANERAAQQAEIAADRQEKAADKAAERAAKTGVQAVEQINESLIETARKFQGFSEHQPAQRGALQDFFKAANQNVDPKMTAWCAAFVNAVLASNGLPGSGSLMARSFLDYGTATQEPQPGDLVILRRGSGNVQGHVGFYMGQENGRVRVLGGNQGDTVSEKSFAASSVLGYRRVPGGQLNESLAKENELRTQQLDLIRQTITAGQDETAGINLETQYIGASNAERERATFLRERLLELERAGIEITPQLRAQVEAEADARYQAVAAYDAQAAAIDRVKQAQEDLQAVQEEISYAFQGALKGLISDLVHGKDATEALFDAVTRLADRFLDLALDQLFTSFFGAGQAGGGIFGLGGLFKLFGFARGGFTGHGGTYQPKGVVHGGEYVFSKAATNRIGVGALDRMHAAAKRGYADGGFVVPTITAAAAGRQAQAMAPAVDARTTVINRFDSASFLSEALSQPEGAKLILNVIKAQPAAFRQAMQG